MIAPLLLAVLFQAGPATETLTADLDGDGSPETVTASLHGKKIRIEVLDANGQRRAAAEAPAPDSGARRIGLTSGPLGSPGALLEVSAASGGRLCRTFWRLRDKELTAVPIGGPKGKLPDCSAAEGWKEQWQKPKEDAPAEWVRERTRRVPQGEHRRTEVYRFSGFELVLDASRSTAQIDGVWIPEWSSESLYPRPLLENLLSGFDLSPFKATTRLRILADRDDGVFAIEIARPSSVERLPVRRGDWDGKREEWKLGILENEKPAWAHLRVSPDQRHPLELSIEGLSEELRQPFVPVNQKTSRGIEVFAGAEDLLARRALAGAWDNSRGEHLSITAVSASPGVIEFGKQRVTLDIAKAPAGADILLVPRDGSAPKTALQLRGPDLFARLPVTCETPAAAQPARCQVAGRGENFRRVGSQVNAR